MALAAAEFASCRDIIDDILVKLELKEFIIVPEGIESPLLRSDREDNWKDFSDKHGNREHGNHTLFNF